MRFLEDQTCLDCHRKTEYLERLLPHMPAVACKQCISKSKKKLISEDEITNKVHPKWTPEQIKSLAAYQESNTFFPFVCLDNHVLTAKEGGLYCFECDHLVPWAYDWTLDWSWKLLEPPEGAGDRAKLPPDTPLGLAAIALEEPGPETQ